MEEHQVEHERDWRNGQLFQNSAPRKCWEGVFRNARKVGEAPGQSGIKVWLRMPRRVRRASRSGPESWLTGGNDRGQALTGVDIGQVLSFERRAIGAPTVYLLAEGNTKQLRHGKWLLRPHGVRDPVHVSLYLMFGTSGDPVCIHREWYLGGSASEGEEPNDWCVRKREVGQTHRC